MAYVLGFLGAGNMAEAIARSAPLGPGQMIAADPSPPRREVFARLGIAVTEHNADVIRQAQQVLIAVKPQMMPQAAQDFAAHLRDDQVVISIMAGVTTAKLGTAIGKPARIVRVMPNTPMLVSQGMAGVASGSGARPGDDDLTMKLFTAGGSKAVRVEETLLDAITAVSGSGPAYVFYLAEAMEKAATQLGLGEHARLLVSQTILGAAKLLCESPDSAAELRRKVTSPGGTTEAAIRHLDGNKTTEVVINAVKAAQKRSQELGA